MALPPLVTLDDFRLWPGVTVTESARESAAALLVRASALVRSYTRATWTATDGTLANVPDEVEGVVLQVAARVWTNPTGAVQRTTGPMGIRWNNDRGEGLFLTDTEKATLAQYRTTASGLQVLSTTRGDMGTGDVWVPTTPGPGPLFPFLAEEDL